MKDFRATTEPAAEVLREHRRLVETIDRRKILRGALSLGALTMLTGCDITDQDSVHDALVKVSGWNDRVQALLFDLNKLAPTYAESDVIHPPRWNAFYDIDDVDPVDPSDWRLELGGAVADKTPWTVARIAQLPRTRTIIRHVCVEGWSYVGDWSGPLLRTFLERAPVPT